MPQSQPDPVQSWEERVETGEVTPAVGKEGEKGFVKKKGGLYFFWNSLGAVVYGTIDFLKRQTKNAIEAPKEN